MFVNVLRYVELTFVNVLGKQLQYVQFDFVNICERSRQETCRINVLGKQYMQLSFVNICECFLDN